VEDKCLNILAERPNDQQAKAEAYPMLLEVYEAMKRYDSALQVLETLRKDYPDDPEINRRITRYKELMKPAGRDTNKPG
jgi:outer membrane protein assembly factor BamD (BamD/ComL family)